MLDTLQHQSNRDIWDVLQCTSHKNIAALEIKATLTNNF